MIEKCLAGLPDSVDFVSIWGNWRHLTEAQTKDLRYVQNVKGTKALMCFIVQNIGDQLTPEEYKDNYLDFWGWNENKEEAKKPIDFEKIKTILAIAGTMEDITYHKQIE